MKRCPQCGREYDNSMMFCLDDGAELLYGPASTEEPGTAILHPTDASGDAPTRAQLHTTEQTAIFARRSGTESEPASGPRKSFDKRLVAAPILLALIVLTGFFGYRYVTQAKPIGSIAVMPFVNDSGNADVEYLSDGMTETLISTLSQLPNLNVKARSSVFRYKGKTTDARTIAQELNVRAILNGRVVQRGDQLTLSLELIDAQTENVIWSDRYDRKQTDLVRLQTEIARDVSSKLKSKLSGEDEQKLAKTYTTNPEAYRLYLQGRFYWNKREEKDFERAVEYFQQATAIDPNYALAYAGLADAYALIGTFGFVEPVEAVPKGREYALRASELDPGLAEPRTTLAYILADYDYDFAAAELEFKRVIELNPNYATARQWHAEVLVNLGRFDEAFAEFRRALELEPLSLPINWDYGRGLYMARRYDDALIQLRKAIEVDPNFARSYRTLADVYRMKGDYANSAEARAKFFELIGRGADASLIRTTFAKEGWGGYQRLVSADDSPIRERNYYITVARALVDLGEHDKAIATLQKGYENRNSSMCWLKVDPQFDPLRNDPRYQELLKKVNLAE